MKVVEVLLLYIGGKKTKEEDVGKYRILSVNIKLKA